MLEELRALQSEGEADFAQEMIDLYLSNVPLLIDSIRQAIDQNLPPQLQHAAHTLKGSSASLGAQQMSALCMELEKLGRSGTVEGATALLAELERVFDRVKVAFQFQTALDHKSSAEDSTSGSS